MTSQKERRKKRRRAEACMDQAYEAAQDGNLTLAQRLSQRSIDEGFVNPRLWLDHGRIHQLAGAHDIAESAFRQAIALSPTYAEAFAELAALQATSGKIVQAARLQRRVVELQPDDEDAQSRLRGYEALLPTTDDAAVEVRAPASLTERSAGADWTSVEAELRANGMARIQTLIREDECRDLIAMWDESIFEHEVESDDEATGRMGYRFFTRPLPPLVLELREEIYARLAVIANAFQSDLGRSDRFPAVLSDFTARCHAANQHRTTPILLHYDAGGFNAPHRDIAGKVVFPFQLVVTLGPGCSDAGNGGELRLVDDRPGKGLREKRMSTGVGDAVVFCTRERLVEISGALGLQPVMHGVTEVSRERFALGIPFHEHG
jgi:hypothetical protein